MLGKISSMFWLLCKTGKCFLIMVLILGSRGLYCVIKLHEVENLSLCVLGCLASSLEMFLISENLLSESQILLRRNATPLGMFSMLLLGKQVLGSTYVKLLVAFENTSTDFF